MAGLDDALAGRGVRVDVWHDDDRPVHGLRPRAGLLSREQHEALHRLAHADQPLGVDAVRSLYAIAQPGRGCTERHTVIGPQVAVRLQ